MITGGAPPAPVVPKTGASKAKSFLRPNEEARLSSCKGIPVWRRVYWAFLSREGCRETEAIELRWNDIDLELGLITLDTNKTNDPRSWKLDDGVARALRCWRRRFRPEAIGTDRVFTTDEGVPITAAHLAATLRADLLLAGVDRPEHATTDARRQFRVHDLRGTFVALALANGETERGCRTESVTNPQ